MHAQRTTTAEASKSSAHIQYEKHLSQTQNSIIFQSTIGYLRNHTNFYIRFHTRALCREKLRAVLAVDQGDEQDQAELRPVERLLDLLDAEFRNHLIPKAFTPRNRWGGVGRRYVDVNGSILYQNIQDIR